MLAVLFDLMCVRTIRGHGLNFNQQQLQWLIKIYRGEYYYYVFLHGIYNKQGMTGTV